MVQNYIIGQEFSHVYSANDRISHSSEGAQSPSSELCKIIIMARVGMQKDGVGLLSALRLGHWWWSKIVGWCRIGECAAARTSVVV